MALGYLLGAAFQSEDKNGKPMVGGSIRVCKHGTSATYITYRDFDGNRNPEYVPLNASGMAVILAEDTSIYDVYCYNRFGCEEWSRLNVRVGHSSGGGGGSAYYAGDGITIDDEDEISVDFTRVQEKLTAGDNISIASDGTISAVDTKYTAGDNVSISSDGVISATDTKYTAGSNINIASDGTISATFAQAQADWDEADSSSPSYIKNKPTIPSSATGVTQYLSWDGESNLFSAIAAIVAGGNVPTLRYQGYDWLCTDSTNDNRFVFCAQLGEGSVVAFAQFFSSQNPYITYRTYAPSYTASDANKIYNVNSAGNGTQWSSLYDLAYNSKSVPVVMYPPTSSDVNTTKKNRAAICRLDKNHSDDGVHTDNCCEFTIHLNTGTTPNGNANSSVSLHVLAQALEDGGPYRVDMRVTGNNNWDLINARPTIALADTGANNDGVIVFFGLFDSADTAWVDFEQTTMTVVVMNPVPVLLGNTDKVNSLSGLTIHRLSPDNIPPVSYGSTNECLCIDSSGALAWEPRMRGILTEYDGQGIISSSIKNLHINTNVGDAGLVRVTPVGGSVQIVGYLAPDYATTGDEGKLLRVNSDATDLEWANPPFVKHDSIRYSSWAHMNPYTEEYPIFGGEMMFKMEWAANDHGLGPSEMTPYLKGKVVTASNWTAYIHVSKGASGNMTYQETSIIHGTTNNTYVDLSQCDYGNGFKVAADRYPMIVNMDIQYVKGPNNYTIGHLTWVKTDDWVFMRTTYDG